MNTVNQGSPEATLGFTAADVRFFAELRDGLDRFSVQSLYEDAEVSDDLPTTDGLRTTGTGDPARSNKDMTSFGQFPMVNVLDTKGHQVAFSTEASTGRGVAGRHRPTSASATRSWPTWPRRSTDGRSTGPTSWRVPSTSSGVTRRTTRSTRPSTPSASASTSTTRCRSSTSPTGSGDHAEDAADEVEKAWKGLSRRTNRPLSDYVEVRATDHAGHVVTVELVASGAGPGVVLQMLSAADTPFQGE